MENHKTTNTTPETITVDSREILFMRKNAPTAFARMIMDSLNADGIEYSRVKIHNELTSIKDKYNADIIHKARYILKTMYKVEYNPTVEEN